MTTLQELQSYKAAGNAYHDGDFFRAAHRFVMNPANTKEERIAALVEIDRVMGVGTRFCTERDLIEYVREFVEEHVEEDDYVREEPE